MVIKKSYIIVGLVFLLFLFPSISANTTITTKSGKILSTNSLINESNIILNATYTNETSFVLYKLLYNSQNENKVNFVKLCGPCKNNIEYKKSIPVTDGNYRLIISETNIAPLPNNTLSLDFKVDLKKPIIQNDGRSPKFTNGSFSLKQVIDKNLKEVKLFTKQASSEEWKQFTMSCSQSINGSEKYTCNVDTSILAENKVTTYKYVAYDFANHTTTSRETTTIIDRTPPAITIFSPVNNSISPKSFILSLGVSEPVSLYYQASPYDKPARICSTCTFTNKLLQLKSNTYEISITATDRAGNQATPKQVSIQIP